MSRQLNLKNDLKLRCFIIHLLKLCLFHNYFILETEVFISGYYIIYLYVDGIQKRNQVI